jgi:signal transduction histidine kinase
MQRILKSPLTDRLEKAVPFTDKRSTFFRYGLVVISCITTSFLFFGTKAILGTVTPFLFLLGAVLLTSWYGGLRAGIATLIFGILFSWITLMQPALFIDSATFARVLFQYLLFIFESILILFLINRRNKNYESMQDRAAQQSLIATIGAFGLEETNIDVVMDRIVRSVTRALDVDYVALFELSPDEKFLRLRSGVGWRRGVVGKMIINAKNGNQASYTLHTNKPVIITDFAKEKRFNGSPLFASQQITSGLSVVIPGHPRPYGVLSVHTSVRRVFTKDDVNFLLALAHVLATTIERNSTQKELEIMANLNSKLISLDPHRTLSEVVSTIVPSFADICEIYIKGNNEKTNLVEIKAVTKEKERLFRELGEKYPPANTSKRLTARVLQSGKATFYPHVPDSYPQDNSTDGDQEKIYKKINMLSNIVVPIKIRSKTAGTIGFGSFNKGRLYTKRDFLFAQEIADRVAIAIDNATLYQEARNAVQARDEFLSIASHELKTPLTSMLLQLQTVLRSIKSQSLADFSIEKTMVSLESTISQSKRLSKLVNDLLNISLITTGRLELEKEKTDLARTVKEVVARFEEQASREGSKITTDLSSKIIGNWDRIRLEQVVTNLVSNAIKYGNGKPIKVELTKNKKYSVLKVIDQGIGIPKEQQEKIFDRFQRGQVNSSIKGLGVGLYLISEIVKAHHGKISVESSSEKGSTFTVQLPL